jgi:hypothetical protein
VLPDGAAPFDASAADASACQPGDISDFKPTWKMPTPFHQGACANGGEPPLWEVFREACLGTSGNEAHCQQFTDPSGPYYKCGQCIATADTVDHYGPLIVHKGWVELNVAGCMANAMNDPSGVKCAASVEAMRECELAACGANCPVSSEPTLAEFNTCTQAADAMLCKSYVDASSCVDQLPDAGDLGKCVEDLSFQQRFDDIVELFCGGSPPMDAGTGPD